MSDNTTCEPATARNGRPRLVFTAFMRIFVERIGGRQYDAQNRAGRRPCRSVHPEAPCAFVLRTLKAFCANQGLLLVGAVAYYALLSIVPPLIPSVIALSQAIDQAEVLDAISIHLESLVRGQSGTVAGELTDFLRHRGVQSGVQVLPEPRHLQ